MALDRQRMDCHLEASRERRVVADFAQSRLQMGSAGATSRIRGCLRDSCALAHQPVVGSP